MKKCSACNGEGFTGSDDDRTPWSVWESLPPGSDLAVRLGLVTKITCESCSGKGEFTIDAEVVESGEPTPTPSPATGPSGRSMTEPTAREWIDMALYANAETTSAWRNDEVLEMLREIRSMLQREDSALHLVTTAIRSIIVPTGMVNPQGQELYTLSAAAS